MDDLLTEFRTWLLEDGKSPRTVDSYCHDVQQYHIYLVEKAVDDQQLLSRFLFVQYKQQVQNRKLAISTINKAINSLKVYNDFLQMKGLVEENFIQLKRDQIQIATGSEHVVTTLTENEVEKLLFYVEDKMKVTSRNKLILYLLLYTGVRVTELIQIKLADIDRLTATLTVRGKGNRVREISLRQDVLVLITEYLKGERSESKFADSEYLLVSQRSEKLHRDSVRSWLAIISEEVGFKLHPHMFRHTFCTRLLNKGVDITTVSKLAGHANVNMTIKYYINITREQKQDAVEKL
ncbi:tyrosine-type recombinase/integrase [Sporosarcina ureae]|uniref:tyrosine-type recombinase/integrase n=1 Tax=Sporosarcina ureae TaxID=1571 RepID=UPI000A17B331|nr:tyrosine-type recombinase/integrase [Sporosarcina ureae]ARK22270.1 integrase [Sporosarcina ureae]